MHTGYAFYTAPHRNTNFILRNLLHVPNITKNLISIFEFFSHSCFVKHQDTHKILLQGVVKDGLYVFPSSNDSLSYSANYACYKPNVHPL